MKSKSTNTSRRNFMKKSAVAVAGIGLVHQSFAAPSPNYTPPESMYLLGPREGYSMHIGTLLSTMTMMRSWVVSQVQDLTVEQLDFQVDDMSNSIGAMLLHLAATEKYYQLNTFDGLEWGTWSDEIKAEWDLGMNLGEEGRKKIKGNTIDFYLKKLEDIRAETKKGFAQRDDEWVFESEPFFGNEPTNNYCKWFHVCEHESNHNGQIKFIKKRF